jgi:hypothetical protein
MAQKIYTVADDCRIHSALTRKNIFLQWEVILPAENVFLPYFNCIYHTLN